MAQLDITGRTPRIGSTRSARIRYPSSPQRSDSSQPQDISPYDRDITDRAQRRGSTRPEISPYDRTRSPSPAINYMTGTQMDRDVVTMKRVITANLKWPSKRKKASSPTQPGRGIRKIVDLFHDLAVLVAKANKHTSMSELDTEEVDDSDVMHADFIGLTEDQIEEELKDRKCCHTAMLLLEKLIPGFQENVSESVDINSLCALLQSGANDARADDTVRLRASIADWLNCRKAPSHGGANPGPTRLLSARDREDRGISNDITGRLLCPIEYDWDNPEIRAKLRDAAPGYDITNSYFLRCLYKGENADPETPEEGFLMGPLLLRTYRHIFTSPSSASKDSENAASSESKRISRRRDVATTLRLNGQVTPRSIAYAATQLVFSLSSAPEWKPEHAGFYYPSFYYFIVDYFEDDDNDEVTRARLSDLLVWWNGQIFPDPVLESGGTVSSHAKKLSQKRLQESRARRDHV